MQKGETEQMTTTEFIALNKPKEYYATLFSFDKMPEKT